MSSTEPAADIGILLVDEYLCVAQKPAGMPVQADQTETPSLLERLTTQLGDRALGLVHRLDRPVSGAVLLARDPEVLRELNSQFRDRQVEKSYWAIVEGVVAVDGTQEWQVLEHRLLHDGRAKRSRVAEAAGPEEGETSILRFKVLAQGERLALLEVRPEGGAFHQIRAQLAAAGTPIRGDVKYGARRGEKDRSIALHARSLAFVHPIHGKAVEVLAPAPSTQVWRAMLGLVEAGATQL